MNSELTPEDIRLASKYIKHYERNAKLWLWFRWFFLLMAIIMIGVSYYLFSLAHAVHDKNTSAFFLEDKNLKTDILDKYIDARIELARLEMALNFKMLFSTIFGGLLLGMAIGGWKRHEHYNLIAKGFRTLIAINQRDEKTSNRVRDGN